MSELSADIVTEITGANVRRAIPYTYRRGREAPPIEDFYVGQVDHSDPILITPGMIGNCAAATKDRNPIHIEDDIAQAVLTLGLVSARLANNFPGVGTVITGINVRLVQKVRIGDELKIDLTVEKITLEKGNLAVGTIVRNQRGEDVLTGSIFVKLPGQSNSAGNGNGQG